MTKQVNGLPFNRYTWLTTHNSFALSGSKSPSGTPVLGPANQEDDVATQLRVSEIVFVVGLFEHLIHFYNCMSLERKIYGF